MEIMLGLGPMFQQMDTLQRLPKVGEVGTECSCYGCVSIFCSRGYSFLLSVSVGFCSLLFAGDLHSILSLLRAFADQRSSGGETESGRVGGEGGAEAP